MNDFNDSFYLELYPDVKKIQKIIIILLVKNKKDFIPMNMPLYIMNIAGKRIWIRILI